MYNKLIEIIKKTKQPLTKSDFIKAFKEIGLNQDSKIEVHASVSNFGYIVNKEYDICDALIETVNKGVIILMAQNREFTNPRTWVNPPVPSEWFEIIDKNRRVYDKDLFIPERIGKVAQLFCKYKDVVKTNHPTLAMSVYNKTADKSWYNHDLDDRKEKNPLKKLAEEDGNILFLGTDFKSCTSIHLTEHLSPYSKLQIFKYKRLNEFGEIEVVEEITKFIDEEDYDNFEEVEKAYRNKYENTDFYKQLNLGLGTITLISAAKLYEIAKDIHINFRKKLSLNNSI